MLDPAQWYPPTLATHQISITVSISLFIARGLGVAATHSWPMSKVWRMTSVAIDVVLLSSGIMLWTMLSYNPLQQQWLGTKMLLLVIYIVLGSYALKRGKTPAIRIGFFLAALLCVFTMVSIAFTRHPLGWFTYL